MPVNRGWRPSSAHAEAIRSPRWRLLKLYPAMVLVYVSLFEIQVDYPRQGSVGAVLPSYSTVYRWHKRPGRALLVGLSPPVHRIEFIASYSVSSFL